MKRAWITLLAALLGAGAALAALDASGQHGHEPTALPVVTAEARRADLEVFRSHFLGRDRSYSQAARAEAQARLAALEARVSDVSQVYFELELARIVALADNGHTNFFAGPRSSRYNHVPLRLTPFGEEFYVVRATAEHADLLGARLIAIDGSAIEALRGGARSLAGGVASWRDRTAPDLFESPEQLQALALTSAMDEATYSFALPSGAIVERRIAAGPPDPARGVFDASRWLYPALTPLEHADWRAALPEQATPWSLRDPDKPFRWRMLGELEAMIVDLRQNNDGVGRTMRDFLGEVQREIAARRPRQFVLDLRMDGGGDLNTTRDFVQALPQLVPGRIFVLTSPWTFSAAISTAGYLKQAAPARVLIVGEGVGDRLQFFAEGDVVALPNSHALILLATERHDYATGCRGFSDCHGSVRRNPIAIASLDPDIAAPWTIEAYLAGRDPAMEAVAAASLR
jgi:hypothetical protein